ncbi:hypothetical protein BVY02_01625, partial [bacterium J17]
MAELDIDVLLLAAGFGSRLRPLTENTPKPLIEVGSKTLIERHLEMLAESGVQRVIVNTHYRAEQLKKYLGDGSDWGLEIVVVHESEILDTGGAIKNILPELRFEQLLTINSDIPFSFTHLRAHQNKTKIGFRLFLVKK